ncbi:uncharacterized protein LOC132743137 [Ruditapes philippinarum]|uniref:uncharacterized protein LOC132743137 n=1 Tax=Ruditapes philippinarum TaxID=129788 RepID=UPI00295B9F0B|nr:uncharacterized protein LOC132743137 [Ruditapes philippinarum]
MAGNCKPCRNCGKVLDIKYNFCFHCGSKTTQKCRCGQTITYEYNFCPTCGLQQTDKRSTDLQSSPQLGTEDLLSQPQRTEPADRQPKIGKKDLVIHAGVKYKDSINSYTLVHRKYGGGIQKLHIDRNASYEKCIDDICEAFQLSKTIEMFLIDNSNHKIDPDGFTVGTFVKSYAYLGATRLYLAVETFETSSSSDDLFDLLPPNLTPQKDVEMLHETIKTGETPRSVDDSSTGYESGELVLHETIKTGGTPRSVDDSSTGYESGGLVLHETIKTGETPRSVDDSSTGYESGGLVLHEIIKTGETPRSVDDSSTGYKSGGLVLHETIKQDKHQES